MFRSELALWVHAHRGWGNDELLGYTLEGPVRIPEGTRWYVRHNDSAASSELIRALVHEIQEKSVPGMSLAGCPLEDAVVAALSELPELELLDLFNADVRGVELDRLLGDRPRLKVLKLAGARLGAVPDAVLGGLSELEHLDLGWVDGADPDTAILEPLRRLKTLVLSGTRLSAVGLRRIASLASLEALRLDETTIDDAGIEELAPLATHLRRLDLSYTKVSATALTTLDRFTELSTLAIRGTPLAGHPRERPVRGAAHPIRTFPLLDAVEGKLIL